jgi:hypothetical protein
VILLKIEIFILLFLRGGNSQSLDKFVFVYFLEFQRRVVRLRKTFSEIVHVLGNTDGLEEVQLTLISLHEDFLIHPFHTGWQLKNFIASWSEVGRHLQERSDHVGQVLRVALRDLWVIASYHLLVETLHILGSKGTSLKMSFCTVSALSFHTARNPGTRYQIFGRMAGLSKPLGTHSMGCQSGCTVTLSLRSCSRSYRQVLRFHPCLRIRLHSNLEDFDTLRSL